MPELMAAKSSLAYLFTWRGRQKGESCEWPNSYSSYSTVAHSICVCLCMYVCCTFSGDPTAILPSPRTANMRTVQQGSDILSIMLFINTSISINSVTTWWFNSWKRQKYKNITLFTCKSINMIIILYNLMAFRLFSYSVLPKWGSGR